MEVGTTNLSDRQRLWLRRMDPDESLQLQLHVIDAFVEEALESKELYVHPEWLIHFERLRGDLVATNSTRVLEFFQSLAIQDPAIKLIDPRSLKLTFLLGAGASAPEPSSIPTVKYLLPELLERARRLGRDDLTRLADFCDTRKISNIEDLLTAAQIASFCSRNPDVLQLFNMLLYREGIGERDTGIRRRSPVVTDTASIAFLQDTFQLLFGLLSNLMLPAQQNAAHEAIVAHTKSRPQTAIVTTNYDCCMDLALGEFGANYDYRIEFSNVGEDHEASETATPLIKLHGSLNWYYCETCQNTHVVDFSKTLRSFLENKVPFPVIAACAHCGGQRRGLLVPPLSMKFDVAPPLNPLMNIAREAFEDSDLIVAIGYSFADADVYITRMLSKSMQGRESQKLLIVDPDNSVVDKLRTRFKYSIPKFDTARIMFAREGCEKFLPKFLSGQLFQEGPPNAPRSTPGVRPRRRATG